MFVCEFELPVQERGYDVLIGYNGDIPPDYGSASYKVRKFSPCSYLILSGLSRAENNSIADDVDWF
jgi:hypothetical protein